MGVAQELSYGLSSTLPAHNYLKYLLSSLPFIVISSLSPSGQVWVSPIFGKRFATTDKNRLMLFTQGLPKTDVLRENVAGEGKHPVGVVAMDPVARRRWRTNGLVVEDGNLSALLQVDVKESFPNCPKYIQQRDVTEETRDLEPLRRGATYEQDDKLSEKDKMLIGISDALFLGSIYEKKGMDANHRGGRRGFVRVVGDNEIFWPEYRGNGMFQTIGNMEMDDRIGVTFIAFETGEVLQLTGRGHVDWDVNHQALNVETAAMEIIRFKIESVRRSVGPITNYRWGEVNLSPYVPLLPEEEQSNKHGFPMETKLVKIVQETEEVKSFRFLAPELIKYLPGQYATFDFGAMPELGTGDEPIVRTWTISEIANSTEGDMTVEVSVKRKKDGLMSNWLHDNAKLDMKAKLLGVDGEMTPFGENMTLPDKMLLISAGIGITPNMAILRGLGSRLSLGKEVSNVVFVHQERYLKNVPFQNELNRRARSSDGRVKLVMMLSKEENIQQEDEATCEKDRIVMGGYINEDVLRQHVTDIPDRVVYLCGPLGFMNKMTNMLLSLGTDADHIITEEFSF